ncbi:hypothetical protein [Scrofimicrobium sp. R131]|uniref:Pilus assembly protein TadE n=1 Tax=Scrofimicrobium appendicitidis TaxID=3079930 RepID=A0AAU7V796_9ACTO
MIDPRQREGSKWEAGMVTVEAAFAVTALVLVFSLLLAGLSTVRAQADLCQRARDAARAAALGENVAGAVQVVAQGRWVEVQASAPAPALGWLPFGQLNCSARTVVEPGVTP